MGAVEWSQVLVTFLAVLVGAAASTAGTVYVQRRDRTIERRVELRERVFAVRAHFPQENPGTPAGTLSARIHADLQTVTRLAEITGRQESKIVVGQILPHLVMMALATDHGDPIQGEWWVGIRSGLDELLERQTTVLRS